MSGSVIPGGLSLFQWIGAVRDDKKEVFADTEEYLHNFEEDVLSSHTLSFDKHWFRLLPRCLSNGLCDWLNEYVLASGSKTSGVTLKSTITGRYGVPKEQLRFERIRMSLGCVKQDSFLERFKALKAKPEVSDRFVIAKVFFDAFPQSISRLIMVAMSQAPEFSFYNLDYASAVASKIDNAVDKKKSHFAGGKKRPSSNNAFVPVSSEAKKSRYALRSFGAVRAPSSGHAAKFVSPFGKTIQEHIVECTCKDCNLHYSRGTAVRSASTAGSGNNKVVLS